MQTGETKFRTRHGQARPPMLGAGPKRLARPWGPRGGGFTLTEIMIAMGVLAVGMAMIAGALHAGIQLHVRTVDDIMRQLIGDNTLAIVQARVRHSTTNLITDKYELLDSSGTGTSYFGPQDLKYPQVITNPPTPYGAAVFMKRRKIDANSSANDYNVLIVPYTVNPSTAGANPSAVTATKFACNITAGTTGSSSGSTITAAADILKAGSVVIDTRNNVQIYFVASTPSSTKAELLETLAVGTNVELITLTPGTLTDRVECSKPMQTKTALSPEPGWKPGQ